MPCVASTVDHEAALMKAPYAEHAAVLWSYVLRLTGAASRAEDVAQLTLLRARQFTVARNMKSRLHYAVRALRLTLQDVGVTR